MSRHGGGVSTALPRHGCVCRGCRARRFLPCHDLGQLVVSVGHGVPRVSVIPPEDSILLLPHSRKSVLVFPRCFSCDSCFPFSKVALSSLSQGDTVVCCRPVGITKRLTARAAGRTAGYRGRVPRTCLCLVVLPAALIFFLHFSTPARAITRCCSPRRGGHTRAARAHAPTWPCGPPCSKRPVTASTAGVC